MTSNDVLAGGLSKASTPVDVQSKYRVTQMTGAGAMQQLGIQQCKTKDCNNIYLFKQSKEQR